MADSPVSRRRGRAARIASEASEPRRADASGTLNAWSLAPGDSRQRVLVIACGALIAEFRRVIELNHWDHVELTAIPADYHITPEKIAEAVRVKIVAARERYGRILVGFGDCGTLGELDAVLATEGVERIDGAHCYAFYAGLAEFDALHEAEPGSFYLTDFLARHFDALTIRGLSIDRHPELKQLYFGNYTRVVYLVQIADPALDAKAEEIARWFGLPLVRRETGLNGLATFLNPTSMATS